MYIIFIFIYLSIFTTIYSWKIHSGNLTTLHPLRKTQRLNAVEDVELIELNEQNVENVLDLIRPQLEMDGGGVVLDKIIDNEVHVKFTGACIGCPQRSVTVKSGIETTLTRFLKSPTNNPIEVKLVEGK